MPELTEVETPKNAGFVQPKGGRSANQKRIEQDEAEQSDNLQDDQCNPARQVPPHITILTEFWVVSIALHDQCARRNEQDHRECKKRQ